MRPVDHEVAVVGAGLTGICAGIKLGEAGIDFAMIERGDDIGGTWRDCTYPGIAVDVPSAHYSLSFEPNPDWSRTYAPGRELKAYADRLVDKYALRPRIRLNTNVERAVWDEQHHVWELHTERGVIRARFILSCSGALTDPRVPDIDGIEEFAGKILHTARWDQGHDLTGERVALIGTGASAVQVLPAIAPIVEQISVFQRTPIWIFPRADYEIPPTVRTLFRRVPVTQLALRAVAAMISDGVLWFGVVHNKRLPFLTRRAERSGRAFVREQVQDPELADRLTPRYGLGCKRPGVSNDYLRTFNRQNVELVTTTIERVTPTGIQTVRREASRDRHAGPRHRVQGLRLREHPRLPAARRRRGRVERVLEEESPPGLRRNLDPRLPELLPHVRPVLDDEPVVPRRFGSGRASRGPRDHRNAQARRHAGGGLQEGERSLPRTRAQPDGRHRVLQQPLRERQQLLLRCSRRRSRAAAQHERRDLVAQWALSVGGLRFPGPAARRCPRRSLARSRSINRASRAVDRAATAQRREVAATDR